MKITRAAAALCAALFALSLPSTAQRPEDADVLETPQTSEVQDGLDDPAEGRRPWRRERLRELREERPGRSDQVRPEGRRRWSPAAGQQERGEPGRRRQFLERFRELQNENGRGPRSARGFREGRGNGQGRGFRGPGEGRRFEAQGARGQRGGRGARGLRGEGRRGGFDAQQLERGFRGSRGEALGGQGAGRGRGGQGCNHGARDGSRGRGRGRGEAAGFRGRAF